MNQGKVFEYAMKLERVERKFRTKLLGLVDIVFVLPRKLIQQLCLHQNTQFNYNITREIQWEYCRNCRKLVNKKEYP